MAKELMDIGGFITEGAEIVNHDNSLSGNGTVDSPLGLNETVLYENTTTTANAGNDIDLSESYKNFEYIRFEVRPIMGNETMYSIFTTKVNAQSSSSLMCGGVLSYYDSNGFKLFCHAFQSKSNTQVYCRYNVSYQGSWTATDRLSTLFVHRIIGINRKQ